MNSTLRAKGKGLWLALIGMGALALLLAGCAIPKPALPRTAPDQVNGYVNITPEELAALLHDGDAVMVNVHVPYEGEIPGTALLIPFDEIMGHVDKLPVRDAQIVLYCRSGAMSLDAARALSGGGYTRIYNLTGGMRAWEAGGRTIVQR